MSKFKKSIQFFTLFSLLAFMGCDHDSSGSNKSSVIEVQCEIQGITPIAFIEGDIGFYDCGAYRIIITVDTKLIHSRESCSGLSIVNFGYPSIGDILLVGYKTENADFGSSPTIIRATYVEGYTSDCITGTIVSQPDPDCKVCPDPFFD